MKKLKLLLLATLMIAGLAQAEPTQVVRGAVQEAVMHQCQDVGIFADYVALKRLMGATIQDEMHDVSKLNALQHQRTVQYVYDHPEVHAPVNVRVYWTCMRSPTLFGVNT
jgi:uncharacterized protein YcfL